MLTDHDEAADSLLLVLSQVITDFPCYLSVNYYLICSILFCKIFVNTSKFGMNVLRCQQVCSLNFRFHYKTLLKKKIKRISELELQQARISLRDRKSLRICKLLFDAGLVGMSSFQLDMNENSPRRRWRRLSNCNKHQYGCIFKGTLNLSHRWSQII